MASPGDCQWIVRCCGLPPYGVHAPPKIFMHRWSHLGLPVGRALLWLPPPMASMRHLKSWCIWRYPGDCQWIVHCCGLSPYGVHASPKIFRHLWPHLGIASGLCAALACPPMASKHHVAFSCIGGLTWGLPVDRALLRLPSSMASMRHLKSSCVWRFPGDLPVDRVKNTHEAKKEARRLAKGSYQ